MARSIAFVLLLSCSPALAQPIGTVTDVPIDVSAFAPYRSDLEAGGAFVDLPVNIPVLGIPIGAARGGSGLESTAQDVEVTYGYDDDDPVWYTQSYAEESVDIVVSGEGSALSPEERERLDVGKPVSCDAPQVRIADEPPESEEAASEQADPTEVTAYCGIGNVTYSVTVICRPDGLEACKGGALPSGMLATLRLLDGDALRR